MISVLGDVSSLALGDGLVKLIESASSLFLFCVSWVGFVVVYLIFLELVLFLFICLYSGLVKDEKKPKLTFYALCLRYSCPSSCNLRMSVQE